MIKKILLILMFNFIVPLCALGFSEDIISDLEYSKYGRNYSYESLGERLNRLETDFFGMAQTGDIESRLSNLSRINSAYRNGVNLPQNGNYYNPKKKGVLRNFWENLTSGFSDNGYITGYTPSINYSSFSGYDNDIYKNNLYGYNPPPFSPYESNVPHRHSSPNHRYSSFNGVNNFNHNGRSNNYRNSSHRNFRPYGKLENPYTTVSSYYIPPNVQTKSSIHILRD